MLSYEKMYDLKREYQEIFDVMNRLPWPHIILLAQFQIFGKFM
jgi:hypothetical protein